MQVCLLSRAEFFDSKSKVTLKCIGIGVTLYLLALSPALFGTCLEPHFPLPYTDTAPGSGVDLHQSDGENLAARSVCDVVISVKLVPQLFPTSSELSLQISTLLSVWSVDLHGSEPERGGVRGEGDWQMI